MVEWYADESLDENIGEGNKERVEEEDEEQECFVEGPVQRALTMRC